LCQTPQRIHRKGKISHPWNISASRTRHVLYKHFTERKWADAFLDGEVLFRSPAYFRDYGDENVGRDTNEGNAIFRPPGGLIVNNQTQRTTFALPEFAFESKANQEEILVFCASRSLTDELRDRFEAVACVEIKLGGLHADAVGRLMRSSFGWQSSRFDSFCQFLWTENGNPRTG
jgi:hypothetical protein